MFGLFGKMENLSFQRRKNAALFEDDMKNIELPKRPQSLYQVKKRSFIKSIHANLRTLAMFSVSCGCLFQRVTRRLVERYIYKRQSEFVEKFMSDTGEKTQLIPRDLLSHFHSEIHVSHLCLQKHCRVGRTERGCW